jgi:hypothetical protein
VGDICIFQPVTNVDARRFMVTVHLFHEASDHHYPVGRNSIGTNHGITPKGLDDITKQQSGRNRYASCQKGSSRGRRNTGKIAEKSTSLEESGYIVFSFEIESGSIVRLQAHTCLEL